jgi:hypothetical protein
MTRLCASLPGALTAIGAVCTLGHPGGPIAHIGFKREVWGYQDRGEWTYRD